MHVGIEANRPYLVESLVYRGHGGGPGRALFWTTIVKNSLGTKPLCTVHCD